MKKVKAEKKKLIVTPLKKALQQLEFSFSLCEKSSKNNKQDLFIVYRAATIQCFEYSYSLSVALIKRKLENYEHNENIDLLSFNNMMRVAAEKGIVSSPKDWFKYREKRNLTSHTYDEKRAKEVYKIIPEFIESVKNLLENIK